MISVKKVDLNMREITTYEVKLSMGSKKELLMLNVKISFFGGGVV